MSYYKFSTPEALAAWAEMLRQEAELKRVCESFCALFGGKPVYLRTAADIRFGGIRFDGAPYNGAELWTKPVQRDSFVQYPRKRVPAALREKSEALHELWNGQRPDYKADKEAFYQSIGLDWGNLMFAGFTMFMHNDVIYISTGATPKPEAGGVEILGSEFETARKAAEAK